MNILDTFYVLFKTNTSEVAGAQKKAESGALAFAASMQHVDAVVEHAGEQIGRTFRWVGERLAAVFAFEELAHFTTENAELNEQLGITAERLNVSVEDLAAYDAATKRSGGQTGEFAQSLDFLNRGLADIATKGTSRLKPFFDELKIKTTSAPHQVRPILDIFGDLTDKLSSLDKQTASGIAEKLGIPPGVLVTMMQGRIAVEELVKREKELGVTTKEDTEIARKYEEAQKDLEQQFRHGANELGSVVLPILQRFFEFISETISYLQQHGPAVTGFFGGLAFVVGVVYREAILRAAAATLVLLAEWLFIPLAILAVGVAVGLLYEDIKAFTEGHKSLIGDLSKRWPEFGEAVKTTIKAVKDIWAWYVDYFKGSVSVLEGFFRLVVVAIKWMGEKSSLAAKEFVKDWANSSPAMAKIIHEIGKLFDWLGAKIKYVVDHIPKLLLNWGQDLNRLADVGEGKITYQQYEKEDRAKTIARMRAQGWAVPDDANTKATMEIARKQITNVDLTPFNSQGAGNSASVADAFSNSSKTFTFNVQPGAVVITAPNADANDIGDMFDDKFSNHLNDLINHFDDGVKS